MDPLSLTNNLENNTPEISSSVQDAPIVPDTPDMQDVPIVPDTTDVQDAGGLNLPAAGSSNEIPLQTSEEMSFEQFSSLPLDLIEALANQFPEQLSELTEQDMSGLSEEGFDESQPDQALSISKDVPGEQTSDSAPASHKLSLKELSKKSRIAIFIAEIILGVILLVFLLQSISLNSSEKINYADSSSTDDISCSDGVLIVNDVSVKVPTDNNVSYNIAYVWGEEDQNYPTIPRSITASYRGDDGTPLYDLTLYKDSFTPKKKIHRGRNAANWFDGWKTGVDGNVRYEKVEDDGISGFLISTVTEDNAIQGAVSQEEDAGSGDSGKSPSSDPSDESGDKNTANETAENAESEESTIYESSTFYFAVMTHDGIYVYVLEGNLYNRSASETMLTAMQAAMHSILINTTS